MKKRIPLTTFILFIINLYYTQNIPSHRIYEWSKAGIKTAIEYQDSINLSDYGGVGDGITENNNALIQSINALNNHSGIIYLANGEFYFTDPIDIPSHVVLKGAGSLNTTLIFNLDSNETDLINVSGLKENVTYDLVSSAFTFESIIVLNQGIGNNFNQGDYIQISKNDSNEITSLWALKTVGQIIEIDEVRGDSIFLNSKLS